MLSVALNLTLYLCLNTQSGAAPLLSTIISDDVINLDLSPRP